MNEKLIVQLRYYLLSTNQNGAADKVTDFSVLSNGDNSTFILKIYEIVNPLYFLK